MFLFVLSLDFEEDFPISEEWGQEIRRRCEEIDSGKAVLVDGDTVLSNLRKKYPGVPSYLQRCIQTFCSMLQIFQWVIHH